MTFHPKYRSMDLLETRMPSRFTIALALLKTVVFSRAYTQLYSQYFTFPVVPNNSFYNPPPNLGSYQRLPSSLSLVGF